jgi:hypothetical protein
MGVKFLDLTDSSQIKLSKFLEAIAEQTLALSANQTNSQEVELRSDATLAKRVLWTLLAGTTSVYLAQNAAVGMSVAGQGVAGLTATFEVEPWRSGLVTGRVAPLGNETVWKAVVDKSMSAPGIGPPARWAIPSAIRDRTHSSATSYVTGRSIRGPKQGRSMFLTVRLPNQAWHAHAPLAPRRTLPKNEISMRRWQNKGKYWSANCQQWRSLVVLC